MNTASSNEVWKDVLFDIETTNSHRLQVSDWGRVRSFSKHADGRLLRGSKQGGYPIIRLKLFKPQTPATQKRLQYMRSQIALLQKKINETEAQYLQASVKDGSKQALKQKLEEQKALLAPLKKKYQKDYKAAELKRTVNMGLLVHRLVAEHFCTRPSEAHSVVLHLDFNKENNHYRNLKWATPEESFAHQQHSPAVIAEKKTRKNRRPETSKVFKLTVTKVMLLKKLMAEGKPLRLLAKQFKVTETQLLRIKRGENWKDIPAAT